MVEIDKAINEAAIEEGRREAAHAEEDSQSWSVLARWV
jgi:hypothetical protein